MVTGIVEDRPIFQILEIDFTFVNLEYPGYITEKNGTGQFPRGGFTTEAEAYCREQGIACSEDERWLESGK